MLKFTQEKSSCSRFVDLTNSSNNSLFTGKIHLLNVLKMNNSHKVTFDGRCFLQAIVRRAVFIATSFLYFVHGLQLVVFVT